MGKRRAEGGVVLQSCRGQKGALWLALPYAMLKAGQPEHGAQGCALLGFKHPQRWSLHKVKVSCSGNWLFSEWNGCFFSESVELCVFQYRLLRTHIFAWKYIFSIWLCCRGSFLHAQCLQHKVGWRKILSFFSKLLSSFGHSQKSCLPRQATGLIQGSCGSYWGLSGNVGIDLTKSIETCHGLWTVGEWERRVS